MEFLGHQVRGDIITPSRDIKPREVPKYSTPNYQEASEIFLGSLRLLQRSYTSLRRYFSTTDRPPKERKGRIYPVERGTGACILPTKRIPVAGASPEASRFEQAVCVTDGRIRSWCGGCATSGKRPQCFFLLIMEHPFHFFYFKTSVKTNMTLEIIPTSLTTGIEINRITNFNYIKLI